MGKHPLDVNENTLRVCDCRNTPRCGRKSERLFKHLTQLPFLANTPLRAADDMYGTGWKEETKTQRGYSSRNRRQLSLGCRQLIISHPQPTFNYTGIQSVMQAADTFIPVSVIAPERNITMLLWNHNTTP